MGTPLPALLGAAKDRVLEQLHDRLAEEGFGDLRHKHGLVFRFVDEEGCRLTDLADRSALTKQAIGELISELEQLDYLERAPAQDDRRAKIIRLTERGRKTRAASARILGEIEQGWAARFGDDEVTTLRHILEEIAHPTN
jgi:DNA-binding MarR family transcriptional regulator